MTDKELLELAAKAAGYVYITHTGYDEEDGVFNTRHWIREGNVEDGNLLLWNPLTDDGDALRLAVKLELSVYSHHLMINVTHTMKAFCELEVIEDDTSDPYAATRRAIVRAAAEIGKAMK